MKTRKLWLIASCFIGVGYIFLGYFFYDWRFHMVPYASTISSGKVAWDLFTDLYFIVLGIAILISSRLASLGKPVAIKFYANIFWIGLAVFVISQFGFSWFVHKSNFLDIFFLDTGVLLALHGPAFILYLTRRRGLSKNETSN